MKSITITITALLLFSNICFSQITKGNWLVGGNALFYTQNGRINGSDSKGYNLNISPDIGYFLANKFAAGLTLNATYVENINRGAKSSSTSLGIGPFARYYFLPTENIVNIFVEGIYQYTTDFNGFGENYFRFSTGPVIYFNSSVGLEFTLNYAHDNTANISAKTISFGVGFQIHLEKEKDL